MSMIKDFCLYVFLFILLAGLFSCSAEQRKSLEVFPLAYGKTNQIVVIADKDMWESAVGDTLRYYFSSAYPILPQPEPIFDLKHFTSEELLADPLRKELRTYLFLCDANDTKSATTRLVTKDLGSEKIRASRENKKATPSIGYDKWAQGQILVYLYSFSHDELITNIKKHYSAIGKRINKSDNSQVEAAAYVSGEDKVMRQKLNDKLGVDIRLPSDYYLAIYDSLSNTAWLRKETTQLSSNILIHRLPYTNKSQLTKAGMKAIRDSLGRQYITTDINGAYMRTNDVDLPMFTNVIPNDELYILESRGIWDIVNDFMGGPFISLLIHKPGASELLFIDGFVHAPGKKKRDYMQQLQQVLVSAQY